MDTMLCYQQEYCTNCPIRKGCQQRKSFYDEDLFNKIMEESNELILFAAYFLYIDAQITFDIIIELNEAMKKKQNEELKQHSSYSID